jgi:hypothetical protein
VFFPVRPSGMERLGQEQGRWDIKDLQNPPCWNPSKYSTFVDPSMLLTDKEIVLLGPHFGVGPGRGGAGYFSRPGPAATSSIHFPAPSQKKSQEHQISGCSEVRGPSVDAEAGGTGQAFSPALRV